MPLRHRAHEGTALDDTAKILLTFGDNLVEGGAITWGVMLVNDDVADHLIKIYIVPAGMGVARVYLKWSGSVPAGESVAINGPYHNNSGAIIKVLGDVAAPNCTATATASEEYAQ